MKIEEYWEFIRHELEFVTLRNKRIDEAVNYSSL